MKTNLALAIRRRRRWMDFTQEELAKRIGCHPKRLCEWENGETAGIGAKYIVALERALELDPGTLLKAYCDDIDRKHEQEERTWQIRGVWQKL